MFSEKEGVFAKRLIKPRTQFGPLEAPPLQDGMTLPPDVFDVRVSRRQGGPGGGGWGGGLILNEMNISLVLSVI